MALDFLKDATNAILVVPTASANQRSLATSPIRRSSTVTPCCSPAPVSCSARGSGSRKAVSRQFPEVYCFCQMVVAQSAQWLQKLAFDGLLHSGIEAGDSIRIEHLLQVEVLPQLLCEALWRLREALRNICSTFGSDEYIQLMVFGVGRNEAVHQHGICASLAALATIVQPVWFWLPGTSLLLPITRTGAPLAKAAIMADVPTPRPMSAEPEILSAPVPSASRAFAARSPPCSLMVEIVALEPICPRARPIIW